MKENEYKRRIRSSLEGIGAKVIPLVTGELTSRGEPDIIGVYEGLPFVIEAKVYPNSPTLIQRERLEEWRSAGTLALVTVYPMHKPFMIANFFEMLNEQEMYIPPFGTLEEVQHYFQDFINAWIE